MSSKIKFELNIGDEKVPIKDIDDLSFDEYNEMKRILNSTESIYYKQRALIYLFTGLSFEIIDTFENIFIIDFNTIFKQEIKTKKIPLKFKNKSLQDLNKITIGKFIDLEFLLLNKELKIEKIAALMYLNNDYINEFESTVNEIYNSMKVTTAIQLVEMFSSFRINIYKDYEGLFSPINNDIEEDPKEPNGDLGKKTAENEDDIEEDPGIRWGLMEFVYSLSNDNILNVEGILKKPLFEVLNYLSWKKEQYDKAIEKQKKDNSIIH